MKKVERKINDLELEKIKSLTAEINNCKLGISDIEVRKYKLINMLLNAENEFSKLQNELMDKYGKVSINIHDGTIKEAGDESDKKD